MPFICKIRTDVPDGILQVLDLDPNESQRNLIYEPPGQTKYINRVQNDLVTLSQPGGGGTPIVTTGTADDLGLSAWLVDNIENAGTGGALTAAETATIAAALIANLDAGLAMTLAAVNVIIAATVAASGIGVGASTGTLADLLSIMAGAEYALPPNSQVDATGTAFTAAALGAFTGGQYRETLTSGALTISLAEGHLSEFSATTFSYKGTTGAAVLVLEDDGTLA